MLTGVEAADQNSDRKILYTIHCESFRLSILMLTHIAKIHPPKTVFLKSPGSLGVLLAWTFPSRAVTANCMQKSPSGTRLSNATWLKRQNWNCAFLRLSSSAWLKLYRSIVERGSDVKIEIYAEYKAGPDCIARKTCKLASLISADDHGAWQNSLGTNITDIITRVSSP